MFRKKGLFLIVLGCLLMSCTVRVIQETNATAAPASPTPDPVQATLVALQEQNVALATRVAVLEQTPTPMPTSTPTPAPTATPTSTPTPEKRSVVRIVVTATPTPTPPPPPTPPSCPISVGADLREKFNDYYLVYSTGCPVAAQETLWSAEQAFEGGRMFWRKDRDEAIILVNSTRKVIITSDVFNEGDPDDACPEFGPAPQGYFKPVRGFNRQWCRNVEVRNQLGWAVENEAGYDTVWQAFDRATIVKSHTGRLFILYNSGYWSYVE